MIEKIPNITDITASHDTNGDRAGDEGESMEVVVAVGMNPVLCWASHEE
ncbi:hypothetical protein ACWDX8_29525 [Streptomyces anthocyanicus]